MAVGMAVSLRKTDRVGAHRSHSHLLSLGSSVRKFSLSWAASGNSKGWGIYASLG